MADFELERRANLLDLIARWADDVAHEIKNPLHAMVINLELVKRRAGSGDPSVVDRVGVVDAELHRVHELIESLLALIRPWPDYPTSDVERVFHALLPVIRARCRVRRVEYEHRPSAGRVMLRPADLALVLVNVIDTAIVAAGPEGRLTTAVEADDAEIRILVSDSGSGPPPRPDAPATGVSGRAEPTGLGLAVSSQLVQSAGGTIHLDPAPHGAGTRVKITLPRAGSA